MVWWGIMNSPISTPRSSSSRYSWESAHGDNKQWAWKSEHGFSGNWYFALNLVLYGCENHALPHHICLHAYSSLLSMLPVINQQTQLCQFSDTCRGGVCEFNISRHRRWLPMLCDSSRCEWSSFGKMIWLPWRVYFGSSPKMCRTGCSSNLRQLLFGGFFFFCKECNIQCKWCWSCVRNCVWSCQISQLRVLSTWGVVKYICNCPKCCMRTP
jgi:hypothetical protein